MSDLAKLAGKGKKVKIGELEIEVKPLTVSDVDLMMGLGKEGVEQASAIKQLIKRVLEDAVPDASDEEIENVSVEHMQQIMEAIIEVNNLETPSAEKEIIAKIKNKTK